MHRRTAGLTPNLECVIGQCCTLSGPNAAVDSASMNRGKGIITRWLRISCLASVVVLGNVLRSQKLNHSSL